MQCISCIFYLLAYHTAIEAGLCKGDVSFVNMVMSGLQYTNEGNTRLSWACSIKSIWVVDIYISTLKHLLNVLLLSSWIKGIKLDNSRLCAWISTWFSILIVHKLGVLTMKSIHVLLRSLWSLNFSVFKTLKPK